MSANSADRVPELARFYRDLRLQGIARKAVALSKSAGASLYLISLGLIGAWIIGVFFGVGFFFLIHHSTQLVSGWGPGNRGAEIIPGFAESNASPRVTSSGPTLSIGPTAENNVAISRELSALAELKMIPGPTERERRILSTELRTSEDRDLIGSLPVEAVASRNVLPSARPAAARERHKRPPSAAPPPRSRAPQQAIRDLLQKHTRLLK